MLIRKIKEMFPGDTITYDQTDKRGKLLLLKELIVLKGGFQSTSLLPWQIFFFFFCIQILVHIGFLTEESGDVFSPKVLKGGPLGEMVQWADIVTALHVLGHNVKISVSLKELHG